MTWVHCTVLWCYSQFILFVILYTIEYSELSESSLIMHGMMASRRGWSFERGVKLIKQSGTVLQARRGGLCYSWHFYQVQRRAVMWCIAWNLTSKQESVQGGPLYCTVYTSSLCSLYNLQYIVQCCCLTVLYHGVGFHVVYSAVQK